MPYGLTEDGMLRQWAHRITAGQQPYPVEPGAEPYANEDGKFRVAVERIKKGVEK